MTDFKPGDHVHHGPSNEDWILSAVSPDGKEVCPAGWPESIAKAEHCTLIEACTQEESDAMTARCAEIRERLPARFVGACTVAPCRTRRSLPMTDIMQGRRRDASDDPIFQLRHDPGDYGKDRDGKWCGRAPNGLYCNLRAHNVTEHEDRTITVTPSIRIAKPTASSKAKCEEWHGFLERGVWRER